MQCTSIQMTFDIMKVKRKIFIHLPLSELGIYGSQSPAIPYSFKPFLKRAEKLTTWLNYNMARAQATGLIYDM